MEPTNWNIDRYRSTADYTFDIVKYWTPESSVGSRVDSLWKSHYLSRSAFVDYSSQDKAFYPVMPHDLAASKMAPLKYFDIDRLEQTDVCGIPFSFTQGTSLSKAMSSQMAYMGIMECAGKSLGTCTLIAEDLVIAARHAVEGLDISTCQVTFGRVQIDGIIYSIETTQLAYAVEENADLDYVIIRLQKAQKSGFAKLQVKEFTSNELALLHYPLDKPLKASVHTYDRPKYQVDRLITYHDSDILSSGGAYFDPACHMVALHLGTEIGKNCFNLLRYALPLDAIVRSNPKSLLKVLAAGAYPQLPSKKCTFLIPTPHQFVINEEGRKSKEVLNRVMQNVQDPKISKNADGIIFSESNLKHIEDHYPDKYKQFIDECTGIVGLHGATKEYSVTSRVESDHIIPHQVWKKTTIDKMKKIVDNGTGKRKGADKMPAITIPFDKHRKLLTTGSSKEAEAFRDKLVTLCDAGKINEALLKCFKEYQDKELNLDKDVIKASLKGHVDLGLIKKRQSTAIFKKLFNL